MDLQTLENLLSHYGLSPNKTYGQHFLMDDMVLHRMAEVAAVDKQDLVIEVGPGIGNLTRILIEQAGRVISIEKDDQFFKILDEYQDKYPNFSYHHKDILKQDMAELVKPGERYKVVANIPYYVTGKIIQYFINCQTRPTSMTLLMQKEVADNLSAKEGRLNLLAISVQLYADVELIEVVQANKFYPPPKVNSAVVKINFYDKPKYQISDEEKLFRVLRSCFAGKRKQIHNTLVNNLQLEKSKVLKILEQVGIEPETRPQQLSIKQWLKLTDLI